MLGNMSASIIQSVHTVGYDYRIVLIFLVGFKCSQCYKYNSTRTKQAVFEHCDPFKRIRSLASAG